MYDKIGMFFITYHIALSCEPVLECVDIVAYRKIDLMLFQQN